MLINDEFTGNDFLLNKTNASHSFKMLLSSSPTVDGLKISNTKIIWANVPFCHNSMTASVIVYIYSLVTAAL